MSPGKFVMADHAVLIRELESHEVLVAVLHVRPSHQWVLQSTNLPVPVGPEARVLLRTAGMIDADCRGLQDEVLLVSGKGKRSRSHDLDSEECAIEQPKRSRTSREITLVAASTADATVAANPASVSIVSTGTTAVFPRVFVCDMVTGMKALDSMSLDVEIKSRFAEVFPDTLFVKQTFYKHRLFYRHASQTGLLPEFISRGTTKDGRWSVLVAEIKKQKEFNKSKGMHLISLHWLPP